jgi:modulator of FtsH protease
MQPQSQVFAARTSDVALSQHRVLRNTYMLLAVSLIPTVIGAMIGANLNFRFMAGSPIISSLIFLAVIYGLFFAIEKNKNSGLGVGLLLLLTFVLGVMLGPILQVALARGAMLVAYAAGATAAVFFTLAGIASTTKRDFSNMGKFLMVGAIVLMIAVLANIFLQIPALSLTISSLFVLFSSAMILYSVNQIVQGGETNYVSATLTLYMSIYNLFTSLLHLILAFTGNDD